MRPLPRAILFDLDNTLVDRDAAMRRVMRRWLAEHSTALRADQADAALDEIMARDRHGYTSRRELCDWLGGRRAADLWQFIGEHIAEQVRPRASVQELLARLQRRYMLALVTNGGFDNQRRKLRHARLASYFDDAVFISGELDAAKPSAEIFEAALADLGVAAHQALFVGDDLARDIAGASAVGMATCRVGWFQPSTPVDAKPDLHVERVEDLHGHLTEWKTSCTT